MADAKDLTPEDAAYWRAAALQDLADVLAVQKLLAEEGPSAKIRLLARLAAEPDGAGLDPAEQLAAGKRRAIAALKVLRAPEPHKADEALRLASTAWTRIGVEKGMDWALALKPLEMFEVSPFQVRLVTDPGPWFEPRNVQDLDSGQLASVRRSGVWSPIHLRIEEDPPSLLAIAGSRRTRMVRVVIREGLEALGMGRDPVRPRPLLALIPAGDVESDIFIGDNILRTGETPWTLAERFAAQLGAGEKLRARDIAARTGLSQRLVSYYLALAGLPARLRAEGAEGRLGVKLASWLAQVPDPEVQLRLFEVTLPLKSEARRMEAARALLEQEGPGLADGRELVLPEPLTVQKKGAVFGSPKLRAGLEAAVAKAKGPAKKQVSLVADWCAAWDGDSEAAARLPAELREALPVAVPEATGQRRRHPSQSRDRREETREETRKINGWPGFSNYEADRWCSAGLSRFSAEHLREEDIHPGTLYADVRLDPQGPAKRIGELYEAGNIDLPRLKELVLETMGPLTLKCPGCHIDHDVECETSTAARPSGSPFLVVDFEGRKVHPERRDQILQLREIMRAPAKATKAGTVDGEGAEIRRVLESERRASKQASKSNAWPMFSPEMQAAWEAAGIGCGDDALEFEAHDVEPATVAQVVQLGEERLTLGAAYTLGKLTMVQILARLRQLPLIPVEAVDPREVICPVCAADVGAACDDGGHPHKVRGQIAAKARELRPVLLGEVA